MSAERKFAHENWKILRNLKEEARQLRQFEASFREEDDCDGIGFSPSQYIRSSPCEKLWRKHGNASNQSNLFMLFSTNRMSGSEIKVEKYCRRSLCPDQPVNSNEEKELDVSISTLAQPIGSTPLPQEAEHQEKSSTSLLAVLQCFLSIPKFIEFITSIAEKFEDEITQRTYPTITFLIDAIQCVQDEENKETSLRLQKVLQSKDLFHIKDEPVSTVLVSMLELLHEEITQAKADRLLSRTCINDCRLTSKNDHSAVTHLFQGHVQRKIFCSCGYHNMLEESITDLAIPTENIEEKSLILNFVGETDGTFGVTRYLFAINQWTNVKTLLSKLNLMLSQENKEFNFDGVMIFLVAEYKVPKALNTNMKIFELLCEEGNLWAFDTTVGDLSLNLYSLLSLTCNTLDGEQSCLGDISSNFNTSRHSELSSYSKSTSTISSDKLDKKRSHSAVVFVQVLWTTLQTSFQMVLRFPKISHGLHILERLSRILDITHTVFPSITLVAKNKSGICVLCLHEDCAGCPVHHNDKILLSQHYTLVILIERTMNVKKISVKDDPSLLSNQHIKIINMHEALSAYSERCEIDLCPSCSKRNWLLSETVLLKCPIIMIIHFPTPLKTEQLFAYPVNRFRPFLRKKHSNTEYSLLSVVLKDHAVLLNTPENRQSALFQQKSLEVPSSQGIELLVYEKVRKASSESGIQKKISKRLKGKQKMLLKTKFSPRTGHVTKQFSHRSSYENDHFTSAAGSFSMCSKPPNEITCHCFQCLTFHQLHSQMLSSRSSVVSSHQDSSNPAKKVNSEKLGVIAEDCCHSHQSQRLSEPEHMLHKALREQDLKEVVRWLDKGADINYIFKGMGALHLAVAMDVPFGVVFTQLCLEHGADPNLSSSEGLTPVHVAVIWGKEATLKLIVEAGGVPSIKDSQGRSAYDILLQENRSNSEMLLRILRGEGNGEEESGPGVTDMCDAPDGPMQKTADSISLLHISERGLSNTRLHEDGNPPPLGLPMDKELNKQFYNDKDLDDDDCIQSITSLSEDPDSHFDSYLHESPVSQHFTYGHSSASYHGSVRRTWFSFLSCGSRRLSKMRRTRQEIRDVSMNVQQTVSRWFRSLMER